MRISADLSQIADLDRVLTAARERPHKVRAQALDRVANRVADEARGIVGGYTTASTGELAGAIYVRGTPVSKFIGADVRQAFFLEYGSPTTGGPRPWLSGPAQKGADELLAELAEAGEIW